MNTDDLGLLELQIAPWINKTIVHAEKKLHGTCNKVVLRHLNVERKPQGDVQAFPVRLEEGMEDEIAPLINQIAAKAQQDTDDMNQGLQLYALYAYFPQD